jgi:hypothetical protein
MELDAALLEDALTTLGAVLESRGHHFEVVAIGGGSLLLLGVIRRPTKDIDIVALIDDARGLMSAEPLPQPLREACADVASTLGLAEDWLNPGPTSLLAFGLPDGFAGRTTKREFGGLIVHLAGRFDQICFKFYAAVDQGPRSKHVQDLSKLAATPGELRAAAAWARTHDPSDGFREMSRQALATFGVEVSDER